MKAFEEAQRKREARQMKHRAWEMSRERRRRYEAENYVITTTSLQNYAKRTGHADPKIALKAIRIMRKQLDRIERLAVLQARRLDWSWREIGRILGVSGQAAYKRHGGKTPRSPIRKMPGPHPTDGRPGIFVEDFYH